MADSNEGILKDEILEVLSADTLNYQRFIELSGELSKLDKENLRFSIDANALINLGRDSIKDHATAIIELVKNGYDADAQKIEIDIFVNTDKKYIRIADNGTGMLQNEVINNWLRIGFSEKKNNKVTAKNRRKTGEKGIGRLSADRLGSKLNLITKPKAEQAYGLSIDWNAFNYQRKNLESIPLNIIQNPAINIPISENNSNDTGTELLIEELRHVWTEIDIQNLYNELSIFSPPNKSRDDFELIINTDIDTNFKGKIIPPYTKSAEVEISILYDGKDEISYTIKDKYGFSDMVEKHIPWMDLLKSVNDVKKIPLNNKLECGPVVFEILFFLDNSSSIVGSNFKLKDLQAFLKNNHGVKIYRDDVSVKPYGYPGLQGGDWLDLGERQGRDPAGIDRESWKVKPYQLIGTILTSRDVNTSLVDSAAREGLLHNAAFYDLRALVLAAVKLIEVHRHNIYKYNSKEKPSKPSSNKILEAYREEVTKLKNELEKIKGELSKSVSFANATNQITLVIDRTKETEKTIEEILDKNRTLSGLATIGISSAVFGHETQISLANLLMSTGTAKKYLELKTPNVPKAIEKLSESMKHADLVSEWGAFSLTRIRREKRKKEIVNVKDVLIKIIEELRPNFKAVDIELQNSLQDVHDKTFQMDIETIFLNLLTNAYTACLQINNAPRIINIIIQLDKNEQTEGYSLIVNDSGHGVNEELRSIIWEPLFTTKTNDKGKEVGTGLGLSIVKSIVEDLNGSYHVSSDATLKGASFKIWLPFNK